MKKLYNFNIKKMMKEMREEVGKIIMIKLKNLGL